MIVLRKRSKELCIGHRLINYDGRCRNVHGHAITVEIEIGCTELNEVGMGIDFDKVSEFLKWLDALWDHAFLVNREDETMWKFLLSEMSKHWSCPLGNPTMENLATWVLEQARSQLDIEFHNFIRCVRIFEKGGNDNVAEVY